MISYFFRCGSWRPLDVCKRMSEDVRTFSTIGNLILELHFFDHFCHPSPASSYLQNPSERSCLKKLEHLSAIVFPKKSVQSGLKSTTRLRHPFNLTYPIKRDPILRAASRRLINPPKFPPVMDVRGERHSEPFSSRFHL